MSSAEGGLGWYQEARTLLPPMVPALPMSAGGGGDWFVPHVLTAARASMADPFAVTALLTGRSETHRARVLAILDDAGLRFDHYGLKPLDEEGFHFFTVTFKLDFIDDLLRLYRPKRVRPHH